MRYLGNNTNIVRDAALTATNGVSSDAIYRTDTAAKAGGGLVELTGPYTGAADTVIDVEIVDNGGSTTQVSQPLFVGVGNGTMTDAEATGVDPQTVTVTLRDPGTQTRSAYAPFQGVTLRARESGSAGNDITIDVDHSGIEATDTDWSLQEDLRQDQNEYIGDHWNFGAAVLEGDRIPLSAPRLRIGTDPQVYRQFKKYVSGRYVYSFNPPPVRDVARGAKIHAISGTRTVTITNGVDTETLPDITTLYDALLQMDASNLISVVDLITNDRKLNGQGITDLSVWTRSYVLGVTNSGTGPITHVELEIEAQDNAPTETLTIECTEATIPGSERWDVHGDVSGDLARATTGVEYSDGRYIYTIPLPPVSPGLAAGRMVVEYIPSEGHSTESPLPGLCVTQPRIGIAAHDGEWTYTYTRRPAEPCDCTSGDLEGGPNDDCLGTTPEGGDVSEASQLIRAQRLASAVRAMLQGNTYPAQHAATWNIPWIETSANILKACLGKLSGGTLEYPLWAASHEYATDTAAEPSPRNGYRYAATTAGTSDATPPTWPTTIGGTVTDGTVTWTCVGKTVYAMYDDVFTQWNGEAQILSLGSIDTVDEWQASHLYSGDDILVRPTTRNGWIYTGDEGTSDATEPTWPTTAGDDVADGTVTWYAFRNYWNASESIPMARTIAPGNGRIYWAQEGGTTGLTEPAWPLAGNGFSFTDGSVTWLTYASGLLTFTTPDVFFERYRTMCTDVLAAAGISEDFDQASTNGDGCWQDRETDYWWVYDGSEPYLPIFTGVYYHSAKLGMDANGKPYAYSTREFGFGPKFGCKESLIEGDQIKVTIIGASGSGGRGYQVGDSFSVRVNSAGPLPFGGGQPGDDTLTWSVRLSVDGAQDDYPLVTTAPTAYSATIGSGSIGFQINPGGIDFALGDTFTFAIEGGRFKWRQDGGSWSSDLDIADTSLASGLSVAFTGGAAPSWVAGDRWSFAAEATFGVDNLRTPIDGEFEWTGSTTISITPASDTETVGIAIANHSIPSDAVIHLQGSDDNFSTTPLDEVVPWRKGDIWHAIAAERAKYRVTIDKGGSARWLYLGESTRAEIASGIAELGSLTKRRRLSKPAQRAAVAGSVEHSGLSQTAVDAIFDMLDHAGDNDDGLIGIVPNDARAELGIVRCTNDPVAVEDVQGFQPADIAHSLQSMTLELEAAA